MSLNPLRVFLDRRAAANVDPYTPEERESFRECLAEGKALRRRRRRRILPSLLRRADQ